MVRGVEIAADVADLPAVGGDPPGDQRRGGADGRAVPPARGGRAAVPSSGDGRGRAWLRRRTPVTVVDPRRATGQSTSSGAGRSGPASAGPTWSSTAAGGRPSRPDLAVPAGGDGARRRGLPRGPRAWSTCTPTCASPAGRRPRRSRPAPGPPPSAGYTAVVAMPNTEPAIDSAGHGRRGARARAGRRWPRWRWPGPSPWAGPGERLAPMAELAALGVRLFTDDGAGVQDGGAHAPGPRVRPGPRGDCSPSTARTTAWPPGAPCTRARGRAASACPGIPAAAEEAMVARDLALVRLTGAPDALPPPLDRRARSSWSAGPRPRGCRSPPRPPRTTSP